MRPLLTALLTLALSIASQGQSQTPGINLGTFTATQSLNSGGTTPVSSYKWSLSPRPINANGSLYLNYSKITGSPSGCLINILFGGTNVTAFPQTFLGFSGNTTPITPGTNPFVIRVVTTGNSGVSYTTLTPQYRCTTYPTGGTITYEFVPDSSADTSYNYVHIATAGCTVILGGPLPAQLHTVVVNNVGTGGEQVTLYDNAACSGTNIIAVITPTNALPFIYDLSTVNGLAVLVSGTGTVGDYTITFR